MQPGTHLYLQGEGASRNVARLFEQKQGGLGRQPQQVCQVNEENGKPWESFLHCHEECTIICLCQALFYQYYVYAILKHVGIGPVVEGELAALTPRLPSPGLTVSDSSPSEGPMSLELTAQQIARYECIVLP